MAALVSDCIGVYQVCWFPSLPRNLPENFIQAFNSLGPRDSYICVSDLTITGSDNGLLVFLDAERDWWSNTESCVEFEISLISGLFRISHKLLVQSKALEQPGFCSTCLKITQALIDSSGSNLELSSGSKLVNWNYSLSRNPSNGGWLGHCQFRQWLFCSTLSNQCCFIMSKSRRKRFNR